MSLHNFAIRIFGVALVVALAALSDVQLAKAQNLVPLQLYWSSQRGDNFVTGAYQGRNDAIAAGYRYVRDETCIFSSQQPGTIPLNLYWGSERGDNFTTATNQGASDAKAAGYAFVRTEGYIYSTEQPGTIPLNLYWGSERGDNFTTATNQGASDAKAAGYAFVRTEGYTYPASMCVSGAEGPTPIQDVRVECCGTSMSGAKVCINATLKNFTSLTVDYSTKYIGLKGGTCVKYDDSHCKKYPHELCIPSCVQISPPTPVIISGPSASVPAQNSKTVEILAPNYAYVMGSLLEVQSADGTLWRALVPPTDSCVR